IRTHDRTGAVYHRGLALPGLRELISKESQNSVELDVLLAICYSLLFQSAEMADTGSPSVFCLNPRNFRIYIISPRNSVTQILLA
ncbi:hypothetical protein RJ035_005425, partial [Blastomyces gilchristii]